MVPLGQLPYFRCGGRSAGKHPSAGRVTLTKPSRRTRVIAFWPPANWHWAVWRGVRHAGPPLPKSGHQEFAPTATLVGLTVIEGSGSLNRPASARASANGGVSVIWLKPPVRVPCVVLPCIACIARQEPE